MANLVMCCGFIVEVRNTLGAKFVCTKIYTSAENTGYTNDSHTIPTIKTPLCQKYVLFCTKNHRRATAAVSPPSHTHRYHGALHSQSAIPRRFNHSRALSRQFRLPSTGLAKAMDHENIELIGYDFAMLCDCRPVIPLSCTHDKLHLRSHSSAVASKLDLQRTKPHGSYATCETVKGRWILRCSEVAGP